MIYLCNGRSATMMHDPRIKEIHEPISEAEFINLLHKTHWKSAIGHENLADCLTRLTGKKVIKDRLNLELKYDDRVILVTLTGRLPEHPKYVEYKGRLTFAYVRFEKQSVEDVKISQNEINELIKMEA